MTQIDELLRQTANAVERDAEAERRAIGLAQRALSAAIAAEASPSEHECQEAASSARHLQGSARAHVKRSRFGHDSGVLSPAATVMSVEVV